MANQLTWKAAIEKVLLEANEPLHAQEITSRIINAGYRTALGATPQQTVYAQLTSSIKHQGAKSPYRRISKGVFALAKTLEGDIANIDAQNSDDSEQYSIITSFGVYWRRSSADLENSTKLLGKQFKSSKIIDFNNQHGIYILYDGREPIYVGRTTDRGIGQRLKEHTADRHAARWDRFSWFGIKPVTDKGTLIVPPDNVDTALIPSVLEALLIEALEPRQNRKRGDELGAVEYIQAEDPVVKKKRIMREIEASL